MEARQSRVALWVQLGLLAAAALMALLATNPPSTWEGGVDLTQPVVAGSWMAWTWATALFFGVIATLLVLMTLWTSTVHEPPRVGVLRFATTPGDRLFVSLLGSAFICLGWLGALGAPLWGALAVSFVYAAAVFRWV